MDNLGMMLCGGVVKWQVAGQLGRSKDCVRRHGLCFRRASQMIGRWGCETLCFNTGVWQETTRIWWFTVVCCMFSWIHFSFRYHYPLQCNRVTILAYVEVQLKGYSLEEAFQTGRQICAEVSWRFDGGFWFWKMKSVANLQSLNWQHHLYIDIRCYLPRLVNFWVMGVTVDKALRKVLPF